MCRSGNCRHDPESQILPLNTSGLLALLREASGIGNQDALGITQDLDSIVKIDPEHKESPLKWCFDQHQRAPRWSGRQDSNLRPLDPQNCGNALNCDNGGIGNVCEPSRRRWALTSLIFWSTDGSQTRHRPGSRPYLTCLPPDLRCCDRYGDGHGVSDEQLPQPAATEPSGRETSQHGCAAASLLALDAGACGAGCPATRIVSSTGAVGRVVTVAAPPT
jgi:hypothetical protein